MTTTTNESTLPHPPRYWWLKRISAASVGFLILLFIVRLIWGWDANRRLQAAIDAVHARGERILPADFVDPIVPDSENYAFFIKQAMAALNSKAQCPSASDMVYPNY